MQTNEMCNHRTNLVILYSMHLTHFHKSMPLLNMTTK